jgi:hypothetical protein
MDDNPLFALTEVAQELIRRLEQQTGVTLPDGALMWPLHGADEDFPGAGDGVPLYPSRELAGTAGLYLWLSQQNFGEVVFANDLSWQVHGLDAVVHDRRRDRYLLCEAKGTERPLHTSPLPYLRQTRRKGRQLSWVWCWRSLADCAFVATTAPLFLGLLGPFLEGRVERFLVVTLIDKENEGWKINRSRAWEEADLAAFPELTQPHDLDRQRAWYAALEARQG